MSFDCDFKVGSRLGFLGVGTMNSAIIEGILNLPISKDCVSDNFSVPIFVSPRGSMKVASLLKKHGNTKIHVCKDNQDLLDKSDVVFIGVRPEQVNNMLEDCSTDDDQAVSNKHQGLIFDANRHCIVNLLSTVSNSQMIDIINRNLSIERTPKIGKNQIIKAVPLPGVQFHSGTTAITPPRQLEGKITRLFNDLGTAVEVEEDHLPYFQAITCMMGPFYQHCLFLQQWISDKTNSQNKENISDCKDDPGKTLQTYLVGFFDTILTDARNSGDSWEQLMKAQTKGGLNEQAMTLLEGTKEVTHKTLDTIVDRLLNRSGK